MWAAQTPQSKQPTAADDAEARRITRDLTNCNSLAALSGVYSSWGGRFNAVNAATAMTMYAKLSRRRDTDTQLLHRLMRCWLQQLPLADVQGCANVLWALGKLGTGVDGVWEPTFEAFLRLVEQHMQSQSGIAQSLANVLWACAKLRKQPAPGQLNILMQAILLPEVLAAAKAQALSNIVWAVGKLTKLKGWQGGVSEADFQQLLGVQQLQLVSATGTPQAISNLLLGLTDTAKAQPPVISKALAQQCSWQLLAESVQHLVDWNPQDICNALHACGQLGLADAPILAASAAAAAGWVPLSQSQIVDQAANACVQAPKAHDSSAAAWAAAAAAGHNSRWQAAAEHAV